MARRRNRWLATIAALICGGCGSSGPATYKVSGEISFDGQPVESGEIVFRAADGSEASRAGPIVDGRYSIRSTVGNKRVEITATRQFRSEGPAASGEPAVSYRSFIPEKYNTQSELSANVTADGTNRFDFHLMP